MEASYYSEALDHCMVLSVDFLSHRHRTKLLGTDNRWESDRELMKKKFSLTEEDIEEAILHWMTTQKLVGLATCSLQVSPKYDRMDQANGYEVTAVVTESP